MYSCLAEAQKEKCNCTEGKFPVGGEICLNVTERKFFVYLELFFIEHFNTLLETSEMMFYKNFKKWICFYLLSEKARRENICLEVMTYMT